MARLVLIKVTIVTPIKVIVPAMRMAFLETGRPKKTQEAFGKTNEIEAHGKREPHEKGQPQRTANGKPKAPRNHIVCPPAFTRLSVAMEAALIPVVMEMI